MTDVCSDSGVAPHSVEHLFQCPACPTQLTAQDLWDNPDMKADFSSLTTTNEGEELWATTTTT